MEVEENKANLPVQPIDSGFMGYFYYGDQIDEPEFISLGADGNLRVDNKERQIQSARWAG